jgi:hypothetical protein
MKRGSALLPGIALLILTAAGCANTHLTKNVLLTPGFSLRPTGGIDIGGLYLEVVHFNPSWTDTEEHDIFKPTVQRPTAADPHLYILTGPFPTPGGTFTLTERINAVDGQVGFAAEMTSDKPIATNELSIAFNLPVQTFGAKQITIDQQPITMPTAPATKDQPTILEQPSVHKIELPTPDGTLQITGDLNILVQDDRPWGDQRYALRLHFSPDKGQITQSKIAFEMKWIPAGS